MFCGLGVGGFQLLRRFGEFVHFGLRSVRSRLIFRLVAAPAGVPAAAATFGLLFVSLFGRLSRGFESFRRLVRCARKFLFVDVGDFILTPPIEN